MKKIAATYSSIIHREKFAIKYFRSLRTAYWMRDAYRTPKNLTIITLHNYQEKSLFEQSLEYLGIRDYVNIIEPFEGPWRHTLKIQFILNYLRSGKCKTKYLLYCDARDSILRVDPQVVLDLFLLQKIHLLFNSSMSKRGFPAMPEILDWTRCHSPRPGRYLNAGAFIGLTDFIQRVFEEAMKYVDPTEYVVLATPEFDELPECPKGADDQIILRYLHPQFHPAMDIDYYNRIFYRN